MWVDGLRDRRAAARRRARDPRRLARARARRARRPRARERAARARHLRDRRSTTTGPIGDWGHDARWGDGLHHALHALLTGEREGYYAAVRERRGRRPRARPASRPRHVVCAQNHDQVGNRAVGDRLPPELLRLASSVVLFAAQTPLLFMGEEYGERTRSSSSPTTSTRRSPRRRARGAGASSPPARVRAATCPTRRTRRRSSARSSRGASSPACASTTAGCWR